jgi:hypothetical protein
MSRLGVRLSAAIVAAFACAVAASRAAFAQGFPPGQGPDIVWSAPSGGLSLGVPKPIQVLKPGDPPEVTVHIRNTGSKPLVCSSDLDMWIIEEVDDQGKGYVNPPAHDNAPPFHNDVTIAPGQTLDQTIGLISPMHPGTWVVDLHRYCDMSPGGWVLPAMTGRVVVEIQSPPNQR